MRLVSIYLTLPLLLCLTAITGCKQIRQLPGFEHEDKICLRSQAGDNETFRATGSASTLEDAKSNARQDLALQISSNVSSAIENTLTASNNRSDRHSTSWTKSETDNIPLDQHRIEQTCKSGNVYYAAVSLDKSQLIKSVKQRMSHLANTAKPELSQIMQQTRYLQYLKAKHLQKSLAQMQSLQKLLTIFEQGIDDNTRDIIDQLQSTVNQSARLVIGLQGSQSPAMSMIEQALNRGELEYQQGAKNAVAVIELKTEDNTQRAGNRFIVKLDATIDVIRADTRKLLKRHNLGRIVTTSAVSEKLAKDNAYKKLSERVRQHLNASPDKIRKILGLE